ncbi:unnamed protein product [Ranitomeya imitator]|uniref:Ig-like domain-containing protein n=1 Tax=Ranitomeya imitator TaxID=111125 RepID=A0ABN9L4Q2_9NEOB|nr:unnamed protein product [Ranitomeya imitator]
MYCLFSCCRWYCEGKELENSPYIQIQRTGDLDTLVITEAFEEDTGRYSCFASNIYGTDSTSAEIYVEGASSSESEGETSKTDMDQYPCSQSVSLAAHVICTGRAAELTDWLQRCQHDISRLYLRSQSENLAEEVSEPAASQEINVPITVVQQGQGTQQILMAIKMMFGFNISPVKENEFLPVRGNMYISSLNLSQNLTTYLQGLDGRPLMAAPVFTKTLQDITSSEGQLVVFESRVKGSPSPKVEWYREGTLIEDSPDFRILQKKPRSMAEPEEICTLVIAEVFSEDSGMFTCTASNKYGTTSSIAYLTVKGSDENPKPPLTISTINIDAFKREPLPPALVEAPPKPKLEGVLVNHNEPRPSSKIGLRVHFNLPDDDKGSEASSEEGILVGRSYFSNNQDMLNGQSYSALSGSMKEPPPVFAKPKLDAMKLQQLHNQVMNEQQVQPSTPNAMARDVQSNPGNQNSSPASQPYMFSRPQQLLTSSDSLNTYPFSAFNTVSPTRPWAVGTQNTSNTSAVSSPSGSTIHPQYNVNESMLPSAPSIPPSWNQFQAQTVTPSPVSPPRIQNPVAFLSSVLPSLPSTPTVTNSMGLPKSASSPFAGSPKKNSVRFSTQDAIQESKNQVVRELEKKLSLREDIPVPKQQEYKISSFEQRLMNEIEFRLERTPVDESDDEVQHDEIPTGRCIAPIFDRRLKHFRIVEGTSVTFTCKVVGIPIPKVYWFKDGKQILKKNEHCRMKREADGTCSLHIDSATNDDDGNYTIMAANPQVALIPVIVYGAIHMSVIFFKEQEAREKSWRHV